MNKFQRSQDILYRTKLMSVGKSRNDGLKNSSTSMWPSIASILYYDNNDLNRGWGRGGAVCFLYLRTRTFPFGAGAYK